MSDTISYMLKSASNQMLGSLGHLLTKARDHAKAREIDEANFLDMRLYPDMFRLTQQVWTACDVAARGSARLSGADMPSFPDDETSFDELIARTQAANAFVQSQDDAALNADPMKTVVMETPRGSMEFPKKIYMASFVLPNVYFHTSMVHALLRHGGVEVGKIDFLAGGRMPGT